MSLAKLNVWITRFGDACHIDDKEPYFVHITDCSGKVLEWCGKKYAGLPAKCGHLEVDIPPGCYSVFASHTPGATGPSFGNRLTHVQVVRANCGDHVCVTLYAPSLWICGTWFAYAVKTQLAGLRAAKIDAELANAAVKAVEALVAKLPPDQAGAAMLKAVDEGGPK
jgi:hypothetical protein